MKTKALRETKVMDVEESRFKPIIAVWLEAETKTVQNKFEAGTYTEKMAQDMAIALGRTAMEADRYQKNYIKKLKAEHELYLKKLENKDLLEEKKKEILAKYGSSKKDESDFSDFSEMPDESQEGDKELDLARDKIKNIFRN